MHRTDKTTIFSNTQRKATVFTGKPMTIKSMDNLMSLFNDMKGNTNPLNELYEDIIDILKTTRDFLAQTDPKYKEKRNKNYKSEKLEAIFEQPKKALLSFNKKYIRHLTNEAKDAFNFCRRAIKERLDSLDKDDVIYQYFHHHENKLKKLFPQQSTKPKPK